MKRILTSSLAAMLFVGALTSVPSTALAREQTGLGIGANVTLGGLSGLALDYWVIPSLVLEFMVVTSFNFPREDAQAIGFNLGLSAGVFGVLAGWEQTNLMLGGRLAMFGQFNPTNAPDTSDDQLAIEIDVPLRIEHWVDDHFAINAQVGVSIVINTDISDNHPATTAGATIGATTGLFGGAGITAYLDGSRTAPTAHVEEERAPVARQAPPPTATTTTTTTTADPEAGGVSWE